jgi:hypothetical protein
MSDDPQRVHCQVGKSLGEVGSMKEERWLTNLADNFEFSLCGQEFAVT